MTQSAIEKALASPAGMVLEKLRAELGGRWLEPGDDPDDRVKCDECACKVTSAALMRFPADQFERIRKNNLKPTQWMFGVARIRNGWVTVPYQQTSCSATKLDVLPIPHRCHLYKPKGAPDDGGVNWFDDDPATPAAGAQRADQARDVGAGVPARGADGGDTQWWD